MQELNSNLRFRFDVSTYRLLGRELITDRITALFELVKNCYDANAQNVSIEFIDVNPIKSTSKIIIKDDGIGMTYEDLRDKWMVIGTSSKRRNSKSPAPFFRKVAGKKGVGRFAVDKLGTKLLLQSKKVGESQRVFLETDWSFYAIEEEQQLVLNFTDENKLFTDIDNRTWYEDANEDEQGTVLEISGITDIWSNKDIQRAIKELSKIIRPNFTQKFPLNVEVTAFEYDINKFLVKSQTIENASLNIELSYYLESEEQEILYVDKGELKKKRVPMRPCGLVGITLYYYDQSAKRKFKLNSDDIIDGIKVYRDGLIATPFAEYADHIDKQKDLFGIDKRRYSGFFDKFSTRDLMGWVDISEERNPKIIDATNRQDFVDNEAWRELKLFVIEQIHQIEKYIKNKKITERKQTKSEFHNTTSDIGEIRTEINELIQNVDFEDKKPQLEDITRKLSKLQGSVKKVLSDYHKLEQEKKQQENLFFSLVSLQTYASMLSHITRTSIGRIKRQAEFIKKWIGNKDKYDVCQKYSGYIFDEMNSLDKAVDFMLKYAKDDQYFVDINVNETLNNLFYNVYDSELKKEGISVLFESNKNLTINYNHKAFEDIFDNLVSNSIKALYGVQQKRLKCSAYIDDNSLVIYFSDNGCGVNIDERDRIFDIFYTQTAEFGGAGLGLFMVKSRLESINGSIEVVENEFKPNGATFKIVFPFKK
ncbi:MAG: sensor histidine kinase [bacterium]